MEFPRTDNECTRAGWIEATIATDYHDLHISHPPEADLDGRFQAFDHDAQELIAVNGWAYGEYTPI